MTGYRSIAVCADGTMDPPPGLDEARHMLGPHGTLRLVHVTRRVPLVSAGAQVPWAGAADPVAGAATWIQDTAAREGVEPVLLVADDAASAVSGWAAEAGCGLLVAAPRHSRLERAILGSFTSDLAHGAPCPVLITRGPAGGAWAAGEAIGTIAAVVDDGPAATMVVHAARAAGGRRLVLVHAMAAGLLRRLTGAGDSSPPEWLLQLAEAEDADEVVIVEGGAGEVADWAQQTAAGMLVAAARNAPGAAKLGSFTTRLTIAAPCPVLIARPPAV